MTTRSELDRKLIAAVERLGRALRVARQQIATAHQLSVLQVQLVEYLESNPARRVGALAAALDVTQPTVSDALRSLEDKGVVSRRQDPSDRRVAIVTLTDLGTELASELVAELAPVLADDRSTDADDEATALKVLLEEIRRLQRNGVISVNRSCPTCQHFQPASRTRQARCLLLKEDLRPRDLRVDCREHVDR